MPGQKVSRNAGFALFQWVLLSAMGWAIGATVRRMAFGAVGATFGFAMRRVVEGAVIGAALGIAQVMMLPGLVSRTWWVLTSALAWGIAWFAGWNLGWSVLGGMGLTMVFVGIGAMAGLVAGILQWLLLRQQFPRAGWWVVASTLGWAAWVWWWRLAEP